MATVVRNNYRALLCLPKICQEPRSEACTVSEQHKLARDWFEHACGTTDQPRHTVSRRTVRKLAFPDGMAPKRGCPGTPGGLRGRVKVAILCEVSRCRALGGTGFPKVLKMTVKWLSGEAFGSTRGLGRADGAPLWAPCGRHF